MTKSKKTLPPVQRDDGWMNLYTGQGIQGNDKRLGTSFGKVLRLTECELTDLYRGDGFGRRIIDLPTGEMVRAWFACAGDTDGGIGKYMDRIRAMQHTLLALRWAHLYGGSIAVLLIDDGGKLDSPVNEGRIKGIEQIRVYDKERLSWSTADLYSDPEDMKYGQVQWYDVSPVSGNPFRVHETRVLRFDGLPVCDKVRAENNGWGDSAFQPVYAQLADLTGAYHATKEIIDDFIQIILKIENLQELIASGQEDLIKKRLSIMDMGRHVMNTIMLDAKEEYSKESSTVTGLPDLLGKFAEALCAVTEIPLTLLMGQSSNGFNAKDEGSMRKWYDKISQDQEDELRPQMERLTYLIMLSSEGPTKGKIIEDWSLIFNPLWQPTEKETVETRKAQAETDKIYIEAGVLTPEEVTISRFGGDEYSIETHVDLEGRPEPESKEDPDDQDKIESE